MPKVDDINMEFHLDMYFRYKSYSVFHSVFLKFLFLDNFGMMDDWPSVNLGNSLQ